jgi:hypothetical protein
MITCLFRGGLVVLPKTQAFRNKGLDRRKVLFELRILVHPPTNEPNGLRIKTTQAYRLLELQSSFLEKSGFTPAASIKKLKKAGKTIAYD